MGKRIQALRYQYMKLHFDKCNVIYKGKKKRKKKLKTLSFILTLIDYKGPAKVFCTLLHDNDKIQINADKILEVDKKRKWNKTLAFFTLHFPLEQVFKTLEVDKDLLPVLWPPSRMMKTMSKTEH